MFAFTVQTYWIRARLFLNFVKGMAFEAFCNDRKTYSAVIREFEIIGEAVGKLPEELRVTRPDVEWQDIKDFRNLLSHEYFGVDLEIVWKIIEDDVPVLLAAIREIMAADNASSHPEPKGSGEAK